MIEHKIKKQKEINLKYETHSLINANQANAKKMLFSSKKSKPKWINFKIIKYLINLYFQKVEEAILNMQSLQTSCRYNCKETRKAIKYYISVKS